MAIQFRLAAFGHTMEKGRVVEWHIAEGSRVEEGQLLVSIETDKTVAEVESPVSGVLLRIVGQVDGEYEVGETLAWIGEEGEEVPEVPAEQPKTSAVEHPAAGRSRAYTGGAAAGRTARHKRRDVARHGSGWPGDQRRCAARCGRRHSQSERSSR